MIVFILIYLTNVRLFAGSITYSCSFISSDRKSKMCFVEPILEVNNQQTTQCSCTVLNEKKISKFKFGEDLVNYY